MPLARIDLIAGKPEGYRRTVGDVVYRAMVDILKAPKDGRFQVINEHPAPNFIFDPRFFGTERSAVCRKTYPSRFQYTSCWRRRSRGLLDEMRSWASSVLLQGALRLRERLERLVARNRRDELVDVPLPF
jgi:hypothetical protein